MIDLEQSLGSLRPDRSLLLCYSASLTHVEFSLLHRLQSQGSGRVTLVVDPRSYAQSFAESTAVAGAGLDYRFSPLRLPYPQAAFHPKLYLLFHEDGATLFVASANLTLPGCRRNAEIVDQVHLRADGSGDIRAVWQYADFLDQLATVDPAIPVTARDDILGSAELLREMLPGEIPDAGPEFLHTLSEPLLDQVFDRVPSTEIREIIAVSPFFDQGSEAVLRLAELYPAAHIHLHRRPESGNDINGSALRSLRGRLTAYDFLLAGEDNQDRPLHAKWVLFVGEARAWLVAGSANLSAPAWLRTAAQEGNVEAVTIREIEDQEQCREFTSWLGGSALPDWADLSPARALTSGVLPFQAFQIREARLEGERIYVHILAGAEAWSAATFTVRLPAPLPAQELERASGQETDGALFWCSAPEALLRDESPVALEVEARSVDGEMASARTWLHRPYALDRDADERSFRRSLRSMERRGLWTEAGDLIRVSDLLARLASRIAEIQTEATDAPVDIEIASGSSPATRTATSEPKERWITGVTAGEGGAVGGAHSTSEPGALLERIVASLRASWKGRLDDFEDAQSRAELRASTGGAAELENVEEEAQEDIPPVRASDVAALIRRLQDVADEILPADDSISDVYARSRMSSALAEFAFFLYLRLEPNEERERLAVLRFLADWFGRVFSIDGFALGRARGWMVRAWMDEETRSEVERVWATRTTAIPMAALLGATLFVSGEDQPASEQRAGPAVAGFQIISGWALGQRHSKWVDELREYSRAIAAFPNAPDAEQIMDTILTPPIHSSPVFRLARECAPLLEDQEGRVLYRTDRDGDEPPSSLRRLYERHAARRRPALLPMTLAADGAVGCSHCYVRLPTADAVRALRGADAIQCQQCGRLLLPLNFKEAGVCTVLEAVLATPTSEAL